MGEVLSRYPDSRRSLRWCAWKLVLAIPMSESPCRFVHTVMRSSHVFSESRRHLHDLSEAALSHLGWPSTLVLLGFKDR